MVRGGADEMFESAYFVIRPEKESSLDGDEKDMVSEAMRIVNGTRYEVKKEKPARSLFGDVMRFIAGFICGGGTVGLILMILFLI